MTSNHKSSDDNHVDSICLGVSRILNQSNSDEDPTTVSVSNPSVSNDMDSDPYFQIHESSNCTRMLDINPKCLIKDSKHGTRLSSRKRGSDISKKTVFVQPHDGKLFKVVSKHSIKKTKPPDISKEVAQCRESHSDYLDFSNMNLQQIPHAILKDLSFIKDLFLYGNKLTTLPSSIGHLTNLRRLLLQQNWLTAAGIPNEITKLTNLEQLDLRYNRLDGPLPTCICSLHNLEHLLLTYNKLTHIVDEIKYLKHLSVLVISRNLIRQDLPSSIGELTKLVKLDLSFNHITSLPDSIGQCASLRDLNLQHNQLTRLPDSVGNLVNLCRLSIKYNQLVEIPSSLANCVKLDEFNVENNQLSSLPHNLLSSLHNLLNITLSRNYFTNFPSGDPQQFQMCYTINMDHNEITNIPKSVFSLASNLIKLNLRDNALDSLIGPDLHELHALVELDLGSNHLTHLPTEINQLVALEVLRLNYNQLN
ncbi:Leucine-rich repeat protein SHOC-2 [Schistosoma japonicum]|nr:Leucine-rich repeat protein SHOC-2 [Schistosoma japonicum]